MSVKELSHRLKKATIYVKQNTEYITQTLIAEKMEVSRTNFSAALNGDEKYLTQGMLSRFVSSFPFINYDWLLSGKGNMLLSEEEQKAIYFKPIPLKTIYEVVNYDVMEADIQEMYINQRAQEGWELVSAVKIKDTDKTPCIRFYFKKDNNKQN